jgi:cytochrome c oxidase cbb3-type subunit III
MNNKILKYHMATLPLLFFSFGAFAQDAGGATADPFFYDRTFGIMLLALAAVVILAAIGALFHLLNIMIKVQQIRIYQEEGLESFLEEVKKQPTESWLRRFYKKITNVVPVEKEKDIMFDHEYDGIRELDNSLPPWWVAMFYVSIAFAVVYMTYYHFAGIGPSSKDEYQQQVEKAEEQTQAFLAKQANLVDENTVEAIMDEQSVSIGKSIYDIHCVACHGSLGEGGVGPNFADKYWIHGGDIKDLFKTIKYGVPEKGMISWQTQLRPVEMQQVASYILTLEGTNPPNGKAPEGELYERGKEAAPDTTATETPGAIGMNR